MKATIYPSNSETFERVESIVNEGLADAETGSATEWTLFAAQCGPFLYLVDEHGFRTVLRFATDAECLDEWCKIDAEYEVYLEHVEIEERNGFTSIYRL
jgi:hypothetical protein